MFAANKQRWGELGSARSGRHADLVTQMGKVGGVLTGLRHASHDVVVIADDDVRWTSTQLRKQCGASMAQRSFGPRTISRRLGGTRTGIPAGRLSPEQRAVTGRDTGGRPDTILRVGGYDGTAVFENLELVRTLEAGGGTQVVALDLLVARLPPTTADFWNQRLRQAYDEWARPTRLLFGPRSCRSSCSAVAERGSPWSSHRSRSRRWAGGRRWRAERVRDHRRAVDTVLGPRAVGDELVGAGRPPDGRCALRIRPASPGGEPPLRAAKAVPRLSFERAPPTITRWHAATG